MSMKQRRSIRSVSFTVQELGIVSWGLKRAGQTRAMLPSTQPLGTSVSCPEEFWARLQRDVEDTWSEDDGVLDDAVGVIHALRDLDLLFTRYLAPGDAQSAERSIGGAEVVNQHHQVMLCLWVLPRISAEVATGGGQFTGRELSTAIEVQRKLQVLQDDLFSGVVGEPARPRPRSFSGRIAWAAAVRFNRWVATSFPDDRHAAFSDTSVFGRLMRRLTRDPHRAVRVRWILGAGSVLVMFGLGSLVLLL
ncbi:hypothetical protein [Glutamicibacter uratoxydans]|uniref:hypothetical protein n=1 Tax=Glutamicibacter uratoxydans TaxID=43667 RepID=UPI003D6FB4F7